MFLLAVVRFYRWGTKDQCNYGMRNGQQMHQKEVIFSQSPAYYFALSLFSFHTPYKVPHRSHSYSITVLLQSLTFNRFHFQNSNELMAGVQFPMCLYSGGKTKVCLLSPMHACLTDISILLSESD